MNTIYRSFYLLKINLHANNLTFAPRVSEKIKMANERLYLESVSLGGYKSIKDTSVDFNKGLNIIIGKNAAGKTNFLTFLYRQLCFNYDGLSSFFSKLNFKNGRSLSVDLTGTLGKNSTSGKPMALSSSIDTQVILDGERLIVEDTTDKLLEGYELVYCTTLLKHGLSEEIPFVTKPFSIRINKDNLDSDLYRFLCEPPHPFFIKSIIADVFLLGTFFQGDDFKIKGLSKAVKDSLGQIDGIKKYLQLMTPIKDIRFNGSLTISINEAKDVCTVSNLLLEFFVDDEWLLFDSLSDGTRRLFYIIAETAFSSRFYFYDNTLGITLNDDYRIILIEEPELGIHPHQFQQVMNFLKEQSLNKQIIITTHSPQALDVLDSTELDSIIVAYYNKEKGTTLRHLNEAEINKARKYIAEEFLSDYWRFSDLEKTAASV